MKANLQKGRPLVIGYISAIIAALLFGCVSTVAKPIVSTLNQLMLASLVYLISGLAITPVVKSKLSLSKKDYSLLFVTSILTLFGEKLNRIGYVAMAIILTGVMFQRI